MIFRSSTFIVVTFVGLLCIACGNHSNSTVSDDEESSNIKASIQATFRPGVAPSGSFEVSVRRIPLRYSTLTGVSDSGTLLFRQDILKDNAYVLVENGKEKIIGRSNGDPWPYLLPNGIVGFSHGPVGTANDRFNSTYPYSADHTPALFFNDGSHLQVSIANLPGKKRATYTLNREWHSTAHLPNDGQIHNTLLKSQKIYEADHPVIFLEKSEDDVIWIQDHDGFDSRGTDKLIRYENGTASEVAMPSGYTNVQRLAETGERIVATFGIVHGSEPYRSYEKTSSGWRELPLPPGFEFSFAQKIFKDGTILGFVTTSDTKKMRNVLWKGDLLAILDELPGWPKQGPKSMSNISNRSGLIGVKEFNSQVFTDSPQYLLQLSSK
jgi:hypothetical protein